MMGGRVIIYYQCVRESIPATFGPGASVEAKLTIIFTDFFVQAASIEAKLAIILVHAPSVDQSWPLFSLIIYDSPDPPASHT